MAGINDIWSSKSNEVTQTVRLRAGFKGSQLTQSQQYESFRSNVVVENGRTVNSDQKPKLAGSFGGNDSQNKNAYYSGGSPGRGAGSEDVEKLNIRAAEQDRQLVLFRLRF